MTCAAAIMVPAGVAVSADSSMWLSFGLDKTSPDDPHLPFSETHSKLAILHGRYIVVHGGASQAGNMTAALAALEVDPAVRNARTPKLVLIGLSKFLASHPGAELFVAWIDEDGKPSAAIVRPGVVMLQKVGTTAGGTVDYGPVAFANRDVIDRLVAQAAIPYAALSLEDAANLSRLLVQTQIDFAGFEMRERQASGFVWTAVATRDGARIVRQPPPWVPRDFGLECKPPLDPSPGGAA